MAKVRKKKYKNKINRERLNKFLELMEKTREKIKDESSTNK